MPDININGYPFISQSGTNQPQLTSNVDMGTVNMSNVDMGNVVTIPRAYFLGTSYNNSTAPTLSAASGITGTLSAYGVILVSQPIGFATTEYLLDFSLVMSGVTAFSTTGSVSLNGFTSKYRLPIYYQGVAGLGNQFILEESRTDSNEVLWFFEWNDTPGTSAGTTHAISGKVISTTKPDWVY